MKDDRREGIDIHEEAAILVGVILPGTVTEDSDPLRELAALAEAAGVPVWVRPRLLITRAMMPSMAPQAMPSPISRLSLPPRRSK